MASSRAKKYIMAAALMAAVLCLCHAADASDFTVKVTRGRLSVKADEAPFGRLMDNIAKSAGFEVTISPDVAQKTLSTEFTDLDLERGIQRLMGLISHRNFFMFYGRDGNIKKIEIYGDKGASKSSPAPPHQPSSPSGMPPGSMPPIVLEPPAPEAPGTPVPSDTKPRTGSIEGVPYIPPAHLPEYIPPRRGIGSGSRK